MGIRFLEKLNSMNFRRVRNLPSTRWGGYPIPSILSGSLISTGIVQCVGKKVDKWIFARVDAKWADFECKCTGVPS